MWDSLFLFMQSPYEQEPSVLFNFSRLISKLFSVKPRDVKRNTFFHSFVYSFRKYPLPSLIFCFAILSTTYNNNPYHQIWNHMKRSGGFKHIVKHISEPYIYELIQSMLFTLHNSQTTDGMYVMEVRFTHKGKLPWLYTHHFTLQIPSLSYAH